MQACKLVSAAPTMMANSTKNICINTRFGDNDLLKCSAATWWIISEGDQLADYKQLPYSFQDSNNYMAPESSNYLILRGLISSINESISTNISEYVDYQDQEFYKQGTYIQTLFKEGNAKSCKHDNTFSALKYFEP